jgi:hypothetical protein
LEDSWFAELCLLLCHPLYFTYNYQRIIGITGRREFGEEEFLDRLNDELKRQEFNNLLFFRLTDNIPDGNGTSFVLNNVATVDSNFLKTQLFYSNFRNRGLNRFILDRNDNETGELVSRWKTAEKKLWQDEPILYHLVKQLQSTSSMAHKSQILIESLSEDLRSKNAYLDFSLNRNSDTGKGGSNMSELMKLKMFYHNEYEILPLWYKRCGHIIKVLTGKRTFKSLFDNNEKKYKD